MLNNAVVQDDTDTANDATVILTPAFTQRHLTCCADFTFTYLQLEHHSAGVASVEREIERVIPPKLPYDFYDPSLDVAKAVHAIKPEAIALGVFGAIASLATLLIAIQLIGRQVRSWTVEGQVLRSLGGGPLTILTDSLVGVVGAVLAGTLAACVMAVCLSPLFPLGPVRPVYPDRGVSFDWTVLGLGALGLVVLLVLAAAVLAWRALPHRASAYSILGSSSRSSKVADTAAGWGLPAPAVTGIRLALEPGSDGVPVRSAILGAVLAMIVVVATVVFGSSLNALVAQPSLYGWNWAYELSGSGGIGDIPGPMADRLLAADPQVSSWSSYYFGNLQVDGRTVPVLGATPGAEVGPPVLSGHRFDGTGQIVLGAGTLARLHKAIGDTVDVAYGAARPTPLRIVGTATMPAIGVSGVTGHLSMGTGAEVDYRFIPASVRDSFGNTPAGPNAVFVRLKAGVDPGSARPGLTHIAGKLSLPTNYGVTVVGVQRPAEIVNYRSMGATPAILGLALAGGAVAALGLTLVASVRRRRREMAMLKTIGFTGRQLAAECRMAGVGRGRGGRRRRDPAGHRAGAAALDALRRADLRGPGHGDPRVGDRGRRGCRAGAGEPRRCRSGEDRRPHAHGVALAGGVNEHGATAHTRSTARQAMPCAAPTTWRDNPWADGHRNTPSTVTPTVDGLVAGRLVTGVPDAVHGENRVP